MNETVFEPPCRQPSEPTLIGSSQTMQSIRRMAAHIAGGDARVLVTGETGVGKDLVARLIHVHSRRRGRAFVAISCAAFSETLLETELFGHVRGSFTGAYRDKIGKLELANKGTVFLDEVGEMSLRMQALLLRFLESGEIQPVGSDGPPRVVDVRVVAATNRNLRDRITDGAFREDLLYRLKVVHIHVPPLRERSEDIRQLVHHTLARAGRRVLFTEDALQALERHEWPGNVRELQNVIEQVSWLPDTEIVRAVDLPPAFQGADSSAAGVHEPRQQPADDLFDGLVARRLEFWRDIRRMFLDREIAKSDLRALMSKALAATHGNYRSIVSLFGMPEHEYKRFLNFLSAHACVVDFRPFRLGQLTAAHRMIPVRSRSTAPVVGKSGEYRAKSSA
jgi:DNA-binding NtrC family response regulator